LPAVRHGKNSKVKSQNSKVKANLCSGTIKNFQKMPRSLYFLYMFCKLKPSKSFPEMTIAILISLIAT